MSLHRLNGGVTRPDGITDRMNASLGHELAALAPKPAMAPTCQPLFEGMRASVAVSPLAILEQAHRRVRSAEQSCSGVVAGVPAGGIQECRTGVDREVEFSQHAHDLAAVSEQLGGEHSAQSESIDQLGTGGSRVFRRPVGFRQRRRQQQGGRACGS
ncbi:hypothetical protein AB0L49_42500 [Streptomyces antimycoticus]|uniref:hypothetical protein n=1 Tax=Streptomyces antimycoticus TaxID=68175 RepID=UPI003435C75D